MVRTTPVPDLLLHLQGETVLDLERIVDLGHRGARKLHVHDGADDFNDVAELMFVSLMYPLKSVATVGQAAKQLGLFRPLPRVQR